MRFKNWFEEMTSTADIAHFRLPIGMVRRNPVKQQKKPAIPILLQFTKDKNKSKEKLDKDAS